MFRLDIHVIHQPALTSSTTSFGVSATWSGPAAVEVGPRKRSPRSRNRPHAGSTARRDIVHAVPDVDRTVRAQRRAVALRPERRRVGLVLRGVVVEDANLEEVSQAIARHPEACGALTLARDHAQPHVQTLEATRASARHRRTADQRVVVLVIVRAVGGKHIRREGGGVFGTFRDRDLEQRFGQRAPEGRDQRLAGRTPGLQMAGERVLARGQDQVRRVDQGAVQIEQHSLRHRHRRAPAGAAGR